MKSTLFVGGGGTFTMVAGRKKWNEARYSNNPANPWGLHSRGAFGVSVAHHAGKQIPNVAE